MGVCDALYILCTTLCRFLVHTSDMVPWQFKLTCPAGAIVLLSFPLLALFWHMPAPVVNIQEGYHDENKCISSLEVRVFCWLLPELLDCGVRLAPVQKGMGRLHWSCANWSQLETIAELHPASEVTPGEVTRDSWVHPTALLLNGGSFAPPSSPTQWGVLPFPFASSGSCWIPFLNSFSLQTQQKAMLGLFYVLGFAGFFFFCQDSELNWLTKRFDKHPEPSQNK